MNPTGVGVGSILIGLLIVMTLATAVYLLGMWAVARMRRGRIEDETTITFPDQPRSEDDRREVEEVRARQRQEGGGTGDLSERAVGHGMRPARQSPSHLGERPVDADHDRGVAPRTTDASGSAKDGPPPL
jgi:hypothetical protein